MWTTATLAGICFAALVMMARPVWRKAWAAQRLRGAVGEMVWYRRLNAEETDTTAERLA